MSAAESASQRAIAQIGEALFGDATLDLIEIANRCNSWAASARTQLVAGMAAVEDRGHLLAIARDARETAARHRARYRHGRAVELEQFARRVEGGA